MKEQIKIKVERPTNNPQKPFLTVFERVVDSDSSVSVPYENLVDCFRFIYGVNSIICVSSTII